MSDGHLGFYKQHGIAPVTYLGEREKHFGRRASLYRSLRLPPLAFRGARVLEVACGTGQNAQYLESLRPRELVLVEPNERHIIWGREHLLPIRLEDFNPRGGFDIVVAENWIGTRELHLLDKLAAMVERDGALVVTCIHPLGYYPNGLRWRLAQRLLTDEMSFEEKTALLVRAFETHLATLPDMTRSPKDWVQDMLLNPAIEHIGLDFPTLAERLGPQGFDILGTSPEFGQDFRWFKSLHGAARRFNEHALEAYKDAEFAFANCADVVGVDTREALREAEWLLRQPEVSAEAVRGMRSFSRLFGRETIHTSWQRR